MFIDNVNFNLILNYMLIFFERYYLAEYTKIT
jgi:hypothetical protein